MKKRLMTIIAGICAVAMLGGCSGKSYKVGENGEVYNDSIVINKYKGLEVEKVEPTAVTDEDIEMSIQSDLEVEWEKVGIKDRPAQDGDTVIIDFVGKKDGVAFDGGSADNSPLTLGSDMFIDGFEDGIIGHTPGETFDLNLTFPADYQSADLAGQAVVFTVTLDAIVPTELTDAMVPMLSQTATTIEEYKAEVKKNLEKNNEESAIESMKSSLLPLLYEECEVTTYPEKELEENIANTTETYTAEYQNYMSYAAAQSKVTVEEYEKTNGMTVDKFVSTMYGITIEEIAKMQCAMKMAMELIAEVEEVEISEKTIDAFVEKYANQLGYDIDEYKKLFEEQNGEGSLQEVALQDKVIEILWNNCKVVEPKVETETETGIEE